MSERSFKSAFEMIGGICREWWVDIAAIDPKTGEEKAGGRPHRAELAQLRRIGVDRLATSERIDVAAACQLGAYRQLRGALGLVKSSYFHGWNADDDFDQAAAVVAAILARVRTENPRLKDERVARLLGLGKDGRAVRDDDDAAARVMAEARFKRLIRTRDWPGLLDQGRRIVNLLGRDVPVADLGASLLLWNAGSSVIRRWSFAYYGVDFADRARDDADATAA